MRRYIDADDAIYRLEKLSYGDSQPKAIRRAGKYLNAFANEQPADVEEVRHGTADIIAENAGIDDAINVSECSCCERTILTWGGEYPQFCSHCGAKMDGGNSENEIGVGE